MFLIKYGVELMKNEIDRKLFEHAKTSHKHAYAPYSGFSVGAALVTEDGDFYVGCNVENAAYPQGSCAEANTIGAMIVGGGKKIDTILVLANGEKPIFPCGGCRQRISEFCNPDTRIVLATSKSVTTEVRFSELFPHSFDAQALI